MDGAHVMRERITRDNVIFVTRLLEEPRPLVDPALPLKILKTLSERNAHWLRGNRVVLEKLLRRFADAVRPGLLLQQ